MRIPAKRSGALITVLGLAVLSVTAQDDTKPNKAQDLGIREQAERQLVQIDVSVQGPEDVLNALTPQDFQLNVMTRVMQDFTVDRVCRESTAPPTRVAEGSADADAAPAAIRETVVPTQIAPTTYVFYFDHVFMSLEGNNLAPEMAKKMIPQLIRDGNRGTVVSSGRAVKTYAGLTTDPDKLTAAIDEMYADHATWWDPTQRSEEAQINELMRVLNEQTADEAAGVATIMAADELWRAEKAFRRFSMTLGRLADLPQPKAVLYFADRLRSNPGQHYMSYFSNTMVKNSAMVGSINAVSDSGRLSFDRVVNEANAHGARLYTIQAEGMQSLGGVSQRRGTAQGASASAGTRHITDSQGTLRSMSSETGGRAFLNGVQAEKIAGSIEEDLSCVFLISFDAAGFPKNDPIPVSVRIANNKVKVQHRGQVFIQSDEKRMTSRLMAAFAAPDTVQGANRVHGSVIPTGFADGQYTALVQLSVGGSPLSGATWDLGMSVLARDKVREDAAERVKVGGPGTPVVFEKTMTFPPGPFEIALVAHESSEDMIATGKIEGSWPKLDSDDAGIGPIAVMQPAAAVFLRDGEHKTRGALGYEEASLLRTDRPTAIISLVCWHKSVTGTLRVERALLGDSSATFPPIDIDASSETCAPILDQIPAGTMGDGEFTYEVRLTQDSTEVMTGVRRFSATGGTPAVAGSAPDTGS